MRKAILFLALGSFLAANVAAYACDGDKAACDTKGKKVKTTDCCKMHAKGTKASMAAKGSKAGHDCCKDMKDTKANQDSKGSSEKKEKAS